jgi:xanthine/uracil permease
VAIRDYLVTAPSEIVHLIMADLFVAGIATIIQAVGFWRFGVRLPLMQGVTVAGDGINSDFPGSCP